MLKKLLIIALLLALGAGLGQAQQLSAKEIKWAKAEITRLEKEINRLKTKLKSATAQQLRTDILDKLDVDQAKLRKLKQQVYPKPAAKPKAPVSVTPKVYGTSEVASEEGATLEGETVAPLTRGGLKYEVAGGYGFFAGVSGLLGEVRVPLHLVFGPATLSLRMATGLCQTLDTSLRYVPVNFDLVFNFPPGWFTGVDNYIGFGLNYIALMTGRKQGTVGGELFYGIESEGFGGIVFGELGYAALRTGFSASQQGMTVLFGYRKPLGF
jgi:hypothetical protein